MIKSNLTEELLLIGEYCIIDFDGYELKFIFPTLEDKLIKRNFDLFLSFCAADIKKLDKELGLKNNFSSKYKLFEVLNLTENDIANTFKTFFLDYAYGSSIEDGVYYWGLKELDEEMFNTFCEHISIACGLKEFSEITVEGEMDEWALKIKANEEKIRATKRKNEVARDRSLSKLLLALKYEFHCSNQELKSMTLYAIYFMYSQVGAIMNYEVGEIASGNGMIDKKTNFNYWSESK